MKIVRNHEAIAQREDSIVNDIIEEAKKIAMKGQISGCIKVKDDNGLDFTSIGAKVYKSTEGSVSLTSRGYCGCTYYHFKIID